MRYFLVTYVQRPHGKLDEQTQVVRNLRRRDIQMSNIILDFRDMKVVACHAQGMSVPRNWDAIHDYFLQHYEATFRRLHAENGRTLTIDRDPPGDSAVQVDDQPELSA